MQSIAHNLQYLKHILIILLVNIQEKRFNKSEQSELFINEFGPNKQQPQNRISWV